MKVKFFLISLLLGVTTLTLSAQETAAPQAGTKPVYKTTFEHGTAADHWFLTLQGGVGAQFLGDNEEKPFMDRLQMSYSLSLGKYHTPSFATRLNLVGAQAHTYYKDGNALKNYETSFVGAHYDFMFDIVNHFSRYNAKRVFHIIPFAGVGYNMKFNKAFEDLHHTAAIDAGLQLQFRLGRRADLVIEGKAIYNNFNFDYSRCPKAKAWNPHPVTRESIYNGLYGALTGGLNFRMGGVEWTEVVPMDYNLINDLNSQISSLRAENAELSKRPVSCPECPELAAQPAKTAEVMSDKTILFKFDSSRIDKNQMITLYNVSEYVKAHNTPILVIGYTDTTGNAQYNLGLSERRAKAVAKALVNDFGVSADMITTQWEGATDKLFDTKAWNRVVIIRSK